GEGNQVNERLVLVDPRDEAYARAHRNTVFNRSAVTEPGDVNKDSLVNPTDEIYIRTHGTTPFNCLRMIAR
ncbi:MAG: hypothetical protein HY718_03815, partial [Planctomycetes bacterium]|nr:hypothetical protein [Planctomycetota bacterium]